MIPTANDTFEFTLPTYPSLRVKQKKTKNQGRLVCNTTLSNPTYLSSIFVKNIWKFYVSTCMCRHHFVTNLSVGLRVKIYFFYDVNFII